MAERSRLRFTAPAALAAFVLGLSALGSGPAVATGPATATIAQVQGTGATTPLLDQQVTVVGVITADFTVDTGSGYRGFTIQDPAGAAGEASQGVFVFTGNTPIEPSIGDSVSVTGRAGEYFGQTQLTVSGAADVELLQADAGVPAPVTLPDSVTGEAREAYESMLVVPESAVLTSSHQLANFGTLWMSVGGEQVKSTEAADAGPAADAIAADNLARRLLLDDGYSIQVSNANYPGTQPYFSADTVVRNGDGFVSPAGGMVLGYGFNEWRLQPQVPLSSESPAEADQYRPSFQSQGEREAQPAAVGGDFSVGTFNLNNYFTTFSNDDSNARGAKDAAQFAIQQSKLVNAILTLDADVVGLQEVQNAVKFGAAADGPLSSLVDALNAVAGAGTWSYVATPAALRDASTTDFITSAIIYQTAAATPVGDSATVVDEAVWGNAREPIAQTFDVAGRTVTVIVNHFKSKSAPSGQTGQPADGQGWFNADRVKQAESLVAFAGQLAADPAKGEDVVLLGDFNSYSQEDPVQAITAAGYTDLNTSAAAGQYAYTFDGERGSLGRIFVSPSLAGQVTGADIWGINSKEWPERAYYGAAADPGIPFRSSDHDPVKADFSSAVNIDIVSMNDFHGRLSAEAPSSSNPTPPAGAAVLAGMVESYRAQNPETLFVAAGDSIGGTTFTSFIQQDTPTLDVLNEIGLDASSFGNHEFDAGRADVENRVLPYANFPYLAANVYADGKPAYQQYSISQVDGVNVAFVGAVTEDLPSLVSPDRIQGLEVRDVATEVNRVADDLTDGVGEQADVIVLLVHEGAATPEVAADDSKFGEIVGGVSDSVDAIVSGHTQQRYDAVIDGRPIIQSGQYGEAYGKMSLSVDPATKELLSIEADVLPLAGQFAPDPEVAKIVADAEAVAVERGSAEVGRIDGSFLRGRQSNGSENRGAESTLGNLVADAHLAAASDRGAQVAFMNPGGLRADLRLEADPATPGDGQGVVTYAEAASVQPFANTLVTVDLTGAQIRQVLEQQWQPAGASRPFLKLGVSSNLTYTYDPAAQAGSRIGTLVLDGQVLADDAVVKVVANSFLAAGGDNFTAFRDGASRADTGLVDLQATVNYFEAAGEPLTPDPAQRAVGVSLSAPDADGYSSGDQVTLTLSSLLFGNGGPQQGTAVVSTADGTELGRAAIDPTIVDTTDEQGRATVTVTIPQGTPAGTLPLTVSVPESGTSALVPLQITSTEQPILSTQAPRITGTPAVGGVLRTDGGRWSETGVTLAYQWNRDGQPIEGATGERYRPVVADAGTSLTVTVTASKQGFGDGTATAEPVSVRKLATGTSGGTDRILVWGKSQVTYTVTVRAAGGVEPVGDVAIYAGDRKLQTVTLQPGAGGRISVKLDLPRGIQLLRAEYAGSPQLSGSRSWPSIVVKF